MKTPVLKYVLFATMLLSIFPLLAIGKKKTVIDKTFPYTKYSTITFKNGDSCFINDVHGEALLKWKYSNDTIIVYSPYKAHKIESIRAEVTPKDGNTILVSTNNKSKLTIVNFLDAEYNEVNKVVMAFGNEIKNTGSFKYFSVNIHKANSAPQPLNLKKGGVLNVFVDYPSIPDHYPYDLYVKYRLVKGKLVKVG
jgi:hypothetical protein